MDDEYEIIFSYTRMQALEDGVLIDVSDMAQECGFKYPVAVTARVWSEVIVPPEEARSMGQSECGRLWDVLWMLFVAIKRSKSGQDTLFYELIVSDGEKQEMVKLKSVCGLGDEGEPVLTILFPEED